ncbi:hypothetical protein QT711_03550 [Sporosarcina saromensis]|uniref:Uncharacterized protein n=1 Tax=Sporosarcina saromensis TaxID=359365 RepID=A0ABU4G5M3_9BACL|nr:hypothetical protein [Sporosarcina saromensis]MDW0112246.1 hypothetical protein [Sporosarcina saromensis]
MPKIGHMVLCENVLKSDEENKTVIMAPFSNLDVPEFPSKVSFMVSIGLFNLPPETTLMCAFFLYSPKGEMMESNFFDIATSSNQNSIHLTLTVKLTDVNFTLEGPHNFRFQIANLNEEKSTFFYVKQSVQGDEHE